MILRDLQNGFALFGGNLNNGSQVGCSYVNLNNVASNANRNIGASLTYLIISPIKDNVLYLPHPLVKINSTLSNQSKRHSLVGNETE